MTSKILLFVFLFCLNPAEEGLADIDSANLVNYLLSKEAGTLTPPELEYLTCKVQSETLLPRRLDFGVWPCLAKQEALLLARGFRQLDQESACSFSNTTYPFYHALCQSYLSVQKGMLTTAQQEAAKALNWANCPFQVYMSSMYLAFVLEEKKQPLKAVRVLKNSLIDHEDEGLHLKIADLYRQANQWSLCWRHWQIARAMNPQVPFLALPEPQIKGYPESSAIPDQPQWISLPDQ